MRKMKDSGIEWIGEIPENWEIKRNKNLFFEVNERCENGNEHQLLSVSEYYGIAPKSEKIGADEFETRALTLDGYKMCKKGDIVMNIMLAWKRSTGVSNYDGIVSPAYCVYRGKNICTSYYHYLFRTDICADMFKRYSTGIIDSRLRLYPDTFLSLFSIVPPIEEQERIAEFLDKKCGEIDEVIAKTEKTIEEYKALKQSVITEAVTKGIRPNRPMKDSGIEWIGQIPEEWDSSSLKRYCTFKTGSTPPTSNNEWFDGDYNWFTPSDFNDSYFLYDSIQKISLKAKEDGVATIIPNNTVLIIGIGGTAGKIGITTNECSCNQQITALLPNINVLSKYLMYWMLANAKFLKDTALYTTLPIINNQTLGEYFFLLPKDLGEQQEIADYLDAKCAEIDKLIEAKQQLLTELETYKKSVIYEYVTGKKEV